MLLFQNAVQLRITVNTTRAGILLPAAIGLKCTGGKLRIYLFILSF